MRRAQLIAALLATAIVAALTPAAAGAKMVPQENSAVSQYTEGFPTGGGETDSKTPSESGVTPGKAIGKKNAHKLEQHGSEGRQAAEVAAVTAPPPVAEGGESDESGKQRQGSGAGAKGGGSSSGGGHPGNGGKSADAGNRGGTGEAAASGGDGSSAVGTLAGAATGAESGQLGFLLPLFLVAALAWGCVYAVRNRKRSAPQ